MKRVIQILCVVVESLALMPFQVIAETLEIKSQTADGSANLNGVPGQHGDTQAYLVAGMSGEPIEPRSAIAPTITLEVIPEPATLSLLALGGLAMVWRRRTVQG